MTNLEELKVGDRVEDVTNGKRGTVLRFMKDGRTPVVRWDDWEFAASIKSLRKLPDRKEDE